METPIAPATNPGPGRVGLRQRARAVLTRLAPRRFLETRQRQWIFQPAAACAAARVDGGVEPVDHWIEFASRDTGGAHLHAQWLAQPQDDAPVLLYLHGVRCNLAGSLARMRRLHELGFAVLGVDYRGFGRSTAALPSEDSTREDAQAAWHWLAQRHPQARRFIYGHSLGGAIAVHLATEVDDAAGLIVEGTFTSIPDVVGTYRWGWLPLASFITQRFDSARRMPHLRVPLLVVHGSLDRHVRPHLGRALYERAHTPKRFVLVEGGSHHDSHALGQAQCRAAVRELFGLAA